MLVIQKLSNQTGADALLFVQGYDSERTAGKFWSDVFAEALVGVHYYYFTVLNIGLIDAKTGDVLWFKTKNVFADMNFRNSKHVDSIIKWFTEDFLKKQ